MARPRRHAQISLRYSSGVEDCGSGDMYASVTAKSAWHAVGVRLGSFLMWCNKPYSRGRVLLASADPAAEPDVDFNLLADRRDYDRLAEGVHRMAGYFAHPQMADVTAHCLRGAKLDDRRITPHRRRCSVPSQGGATQARSSGADATSSGRMGVPTQSCSR